MNKSNKIYLKSFPFKFTDIDFKNTAYICVDSISDHDLREYV